MLLRPRLAFLTAALCVVTSIHAAETTAKSFDAATAINALGLDLYREHIKSAKGEGILLSPYSIATALAMTYAGADGETQAEMQKTLHLPHDATLAATGFHELSQQLSDVVHASDKQVAQLHAQGEKATPIQLNVANRLFLQSSFVLRPSFVQHLQLHFDASTTALDFKNNPNGARQTINQWVAQQTHDKIRELLPVGQPDEATRLTLVNAIYLKAPWETAFKRTLTKPERFHLVTTNAVPVPTMFAEQNFGYIKHRSYTAVSLPYLGNRLQLVLLIPTAKDGLANLEHALTTESFAECVNLPSRKVQLHLPTFKLEPELIPLASALQSLGMRTAFDSPKRSANFSLMAPPQPDGYLALSDVLHKTWLSLDEDGTEAVAATSEVIVLTPFGSAAHQEPKPIIVRADRPFMFAIQHVESGACLFIGRVTDPR